MTIYEKAYDEYLEFLTSAPTLEQIVHFDPSEETKTRIQYLFATQDGKRLTEEEKKELDEYTKAAYFMGMLQVRARRKLGMQQDS